MQILPGVDQAMNGKKLVEPRPTAGYALGLSQPRIEKKPHPILLERASCDNCRRAPVLEVEVR